MNILFITSSLGFGGAEKMLTFVANSLSRRGHNVSIANLRRVPEYVNAQRRPVDEDVNVYEKQGDTSTLNDIRFLMKISKQQNPDVIVGFTSYPNMYARIIGGFLNIPSIMSERGDPYKTNSKTFKGMVSEVIINSSKGGVFQTNGAREYYSKRLQKRGIVIPNPIFVNGEIPSVDYEQREKTVVSVGRLDNFQKRYDVMLDAFKLFSDKHPEFVLKLYGKGEDEELIKKWVIDKGLYDKVLFMGLTKQPMQDICKDGMFIITSDYEGISNSLLEAMAAGLPCVSTDHSPGGARLLITDHENGLLAPVGDAKELANAMCEYAENSELAAKCGEKARDVVARFAPETIIDKWESYLSDIANIKK